MGAKQSSPTAANGRTRAYSGGDLPSSSSSSSGGANGTGGRSAGGGGRYAHLAAAPHAAPGGAAAGGAAAAGSAAGSAPRSRSLGGATASGARAAQSAFNIPHSSGPYGSQDSVSSTPEEGGRERPAGGGGGGGSSGGPRLVIGSLPAHLSPHLFGGFKCPVCSKFVSSDEMDLHLVMCLTKPRITYNGKKERMC
ncbi:E3 ubiquitin-protein ligase ZNRF2 isoform X1 [Anomalospiza imberbis]|uniref:E3 ubiquitin-protein ligase ZNRF2 isoform X1 n=1 Tax=Anomalospiza imberbis TaxID=187417 RepID=UPI00358FD0FE